VSANRVLLASVSFVLLAASPAKVPTVRLSFESKAGKGILWVHRPATMRVSLKGSWPQVGGLVWALDVEGAPRASGTVVVDSPGHPERELEKVLEITDEDYAAGRAIGPPEWLRADSHREPEHNSTRRRLLVEISIRNGETNQVIAKGHSEVMIEPVPMNRR
jgi:hypothetical protein